MGQSIVYCAHCRSQLREADFEKGRAIRFEDRACCVKCAGDVIKSLPPDQARKLLARLSAPPPPERSPAPSSTRLQRPPSRGVPSGGLAAAAAAVIAIVLVAVSLSRNDPPPPPVEDKPARPAPVPVPAAKPVPPAAVRGPEPSATPPPAPLDGTAEKALEAVKEFRKATPNDFDRRNILAQEAVWACRNSPLLAEAQKELDDCKKQEAEAYAADLKIMDKEIEDAIRGEKFILAVEILQNAKKRRASAAWALAVGKRHRDISTAALKLFGTLKEKAVEARLNGRAAEVRAISDRVAAWGFAELVDELKEALR